VAAQQRTGAERAGRFQGDLHERQRARHHLWFRIADFLAKAENYDEAAKIMSARVGMDAAKYKELMKGTFFLDLAGNQKHFAKGETLESVYYSNKVVDEFQVKNDVYKKSVDFSGYLDSSIVNELAASLAKAP
jgi:NitT/TauT family transport system substrate-binding protein